MADHSRGELAGRLARTLRPESTGSGVELSIWEQVLADPLDTTPTPRTLRELLVALDYESHQRSSIVIELIATVGRRVLETPNLLLEELAFTSLG